MKRIIYQNPDSSVSIIVPSPDALDGYVLVVLAKKDVPDGLPYWIVDTATIPTDRTFRAAWELSESAGAPDGYGAESNEFPAEVVL